MAKGSGDGLTIAIAQLNPIVGDLAGNAEKIVAAAREASAQGAQLMLTPELSLCGYPPRDLLLRPRFIAEQETWLAQIAAQIPAELALLVGYGAPNPAAAIAGEKPLFNSTALLQGGQVQQVFHKQLLPTYDVFDEDRYFAPSPQVSHFTLAVGGRSLRVGVTICEDLWNEETFWGQRKYAQNPIAALAAAQVQVIVNLSASPFSVGKRETRERMLGHSADRYDLPILYANQVGANDDLIFDGSSLVVNRQGEIVGRGAAFHPDLLTVTYDLEKGDVGAATVAPTSPGGYGELWGALVLGVRDYAQKCGFQRAVVGLSGGVDSALVAAIATAALGPAQVLGILMPSPYSSDHSISDAQTLAHTLGIQTHTLPIGPLMAQYDQVLANLFADTAFGVAEENIQSRIRGNLLMAISNKFGHLLLSTGNKSEMAVGYCTLYGDMNGGLAVIADVPKTTVYGLCEWLNQQRIALPESVDWAGLGLGFAIPGRAGEGVIPVSILTKPPSAELKPGQVDQDSLPSYEVLDDVLDRLIQGHGSAADIIAAGHDPAVVERIIRLVSRAEFKRRQAPPVLKVTDRAFGMGWRMPIASRWHPQT